MTDLTITMWTTELNGDQGATYTRTYPATTRRHDALRNLASFALATWDRDRFTWVRVPRRFIRVNSAQGVAWDTRNVASAAYFAN